MNGSRTHLKGFNENGMALAIVVIFLAVLSAAAFAFIYKVGARASATNSRGAYLQAQYLAESAANHSVWRLLNDPGFPEKEDVYYMHSLGQGRYGYKVKRPTAVTFAAVATVGAVANHAVHQSYVQYIIPENMMVVYADEERSSHPYRRMVGANFDPPNATFEGVHKKTYWAELVGHPFQNEFVAGFIDHNQDIHLGVWNGSSWGNSLQFIVDTDNDYKGLDIAYDTYNGHALAVGYDSQQPGVVMYTVWNGSAWTTPAQAFDIGTGETIVYIQAEGSPVSCEILIAVADSGSNILLYRWDGATFLNLAILDTGAASTTDWVVNITYEQQSGEALIVWGRSASTSCQYATWNGSALSSTASLPAFDSAAHIIRTAADPTGNTIFLAAVTENIQIHGAVWDGSAWTDSTAVETLNIEQPSSPEYLNFDVAFESSGSEMIAAWSKSNQNRVKYFRWEKGTPLSGITSADGPDFNDNIRSMHLCRIPGGDRIALLGNNASSEVRYSLWNGEMFRGDPAVLLTDDHPTDKNLAFDAAFSNYLGGSTGPPLPN